MKSSFIILSFILSSSFSYANSDNSNKKEDHFISEISSAIEESYQSLTADFELQDRVKVQLGYLEQDMCFATHVPKGCVLQGANLKITYPLDKLYAYASVGKLQSIEGRNKDGKANISTIPAEIGIGLAYIHNESLKSIYEVGYSTSSDNEDYYSGGNSNFNDGFKIKAYLEGKVSEDFSIGAGLVHDRTQNSSHSQHHGTKGKKPKMNFTNGEVFANYKLTPNITVRAKIIKMLIRPDESTTSASSTDPYDQDYPGVDYAVEFEYKFSK